MKSASEQPPAELLSDVSSPLPPAKSVSILCVYLNHYPQLYARGMSLMLVFYILSLNSEILQP